MIRYHAIIIRGRGFQQVVLVIAEDIRLWCFNRQCIIGPLTYATDARKRFCYILNGPLYLEKNVNNEDNYNTKEKKKNSCTIYFFATGKFRDLAVITNYHAVPHPLIEFRIRQSYSLVTHAIWESFNFFQFFVRKTNEKSSTVCISRITLYSGRMFVQHHQVFSSRDGRDSVKCICVPR